MQSPIRLALTSLACGTVPASPKDPSPPAGTAIGATGNSVSRAKLGSGKAGAHELTASKPVGLQVRGYGSYTSYQYPGGLNLKSITPPPVK